MKVIWCDDKSQDDAELQSFMAEWYITDASDVLRTTDDEEVLRQLTAHQDVRLLIMDLLFNQPEDETVTPLGITYLERIRRNHADLLVATRSVVAKASMFGALYRDFARLGVRDHFVAHDRSPFSSLRRRVLLETLKQENSGELPPRRAVLDHEMCVAPNPFLLKGRRFERDPQKVFIVQAWDLRKTVFKAITKILSEHGYKATHAQDRGGQVVFEPIWRMLNEAGIVLVDFTQERPNVYLEYGMALVLGKPIVAIAQKKEEIPSDTQNLKYILYSNALGDSTLEQELPKSLKHTAEDIELATRTV